MEREFGFAFIDESTEHYLMNIALNSYCKKPVHQFHRKHILVTVIQEEILLIPRIFIAALASNILRYS